MGKLGLAGTSLAAAIPGAALFYVLLMAVLKSLDKMPMMMKVSALLTLVIAIVMALFPLYILVMFRRDKVVLASKIGAGAGAAALAAGHDGELFTDDLVDEGQLEDSHAEPADDWQASEDLEGEEQVDEDELTQTAEFEAAEDQYPTSEFEAEELPSESEDDVFGKTVQDLGSPGLADDLFAAEGESEDSQQTMEFETEDVDQFAETMEEFNSPDEEDEFTPAAGFEDEFTFEDFEDEDKDDKHK